MHLGKKLYKNQEKENEYIIHILIYSQHQFFTVRLSCACYPSFIDLMNRTVINLSLPCTMYIVHYTSSKYCTGKQLIRAENLRIVDIEINASSPLFTILPTYLNFLIPEIEN